MGDHPALSLARIWQMSPDMKSLKPFILLMISLFFCVQAWSTQPPCDLMVSIGEIKGLGLVEEQWKAGSKFATGVPFWATAYIFYQHSVASNTGSQDLAVALGDVFDVSWGSGMRYIGQLIQSGWIETVPRPEDGRSKKMVITSKGHEQWISYLSERGLTPETVSGFFENLSTENSLLVSGDLGTLIFVASRITTRFPEPTIISHLETARSRDLMEKNLDISIEVFRKSFRRLVSDGWLVTQPLPSDMRKKQVFLSDKAVELLRSLTASFR